MLGGSEPLEAVDERGLARVTHALAQLKRDIPKGIDFRRHAPDK